MKCCRENWRGSVRFREISVERVPQKGRARADRKHLRERLRSLLPLLRSLSPSANTIIAVGAVFAVLVGSFGGILWGRHA